MPMPNVNPRIKGKEFVEAAGSMYFSVKQSNFGSFLSSEQVKQFFSEEQVAHNEGQELQTGFVEEALKKYPVEHSQVPEEQELAQFA